MTNSFKHTMDMQGPPESEEESQRNLSRHILQMKALHEAARNLNTLTEPKQILHDFLLMAMGPLGITQGFVSLSNVETREVELISRGLAQSDLDWLQSNLPQLIDQCSNSPSGSERSLPFLVRWVSPHGPAEESISPQWTQALLQWRVDRNWWGFFGVGAKLLGGDYDKVEAEFLLTMTHTLIAALKSVMSSQATRRLKADLLRREQENEDVFQEAARTRSALDKRIFHLKTLYDTTVELSRLYEIKSIMETFLLMIMGTFSVRQGYILLSGHDERSFHLVQRGMENDSLARLPADRAEAIAAQLADAARSKNLPPMSALEVTDKTLLDKVFPLRANRGILLKVDETCQGLIVIGDKITQEGYTEDERELLLTLANNFLAFLGNARSFETITQLNDALERRNIELEKTIEDLTASRHKIEVLERAKSQIKSLIQREMERIGRVSAVDFLLMLGLGLVLGLVFNVANPNGIHIIPESWTRIAPHSIDAEWAKIKHDTGGAIFVDARPAEFFEREHIPEAVNLPLALFDFVYMMKFARLDPEKELVIYGRSVSRLYDEEVAFKLTLRGHKSIRVLSDGLTAWKVKGYPLAP